MKKKAIPRSEAVKALKKTIESKYGKGIIQEASETDNLFLLRRPCGIFSLDLATHGGVPAGALSEFAGPEGIGKNYLANLYIKKCQEIYGKESHVFIACTEYDYDKLFARTCGVQIELSDSEIKDLEKSNGVKYTKEERLTYKNQVGEIFIIQNGTDEQRLQSSLDAIKSTAFQLGIFDSIGVLSSEGEMGKDLDESARVADRATLQTNFMNKFYEAIRNTETAFIALNQLRAVQNAPMARSFSGRYKSADSCAIKHGACLNLFLNPGMQLRDGPITIGKMIKWEIMKGKAGFHEGALGEWQYLFKGGIDLVEDFLNVAIKYSKQEGGWYTFMDHRFHGRSEFAAFFKDSTDSLERLEEAKRYILLQEQIPFRWK